jgi:pimeloyl-ACP methyl ester carboxylesterase
LIYDLWGRGYSQAPAVTYDEALYTSQLAMLLQKVGWDKTGVVGVSLGGAIATSFASFYPEMVNKLVLISPAGLINSETDMPLISKVVKLPYVHQFITNQPYVRPLLVKVAENFARSTQLEQTGLDDETEAASNYIAKVATYQFLHHAGLLRAFIGTVVAFPLTDLEDKYKKVGQTDIPTLVIWGDKDKVRDVLLYIIAILSFI